MTPKEKMEALEQEIDRHNRSYYELDAPEISDAEYDELVRQLKELERLYPQWVSPNSPTQKVGVKVSSGPFKEFRRDIPMLSLNNAMDVDEIKAFYNRVQKMTELMVRKGEDSDILYIAEPKFDGLSIEIIYRDGVLFRAGTRGDGLVGEDVTNNVMVIQSIPKQSPQGTISNFTVRGEVFINKEDFERLNEERIAESKPPFANPRNAAAGSLRQLDPSETEKRNLQSVFYYFRPEDPIFREPPTQKMSLTTLSLMGFTTPLNFGAKVLKTLDEIVQFYKEIEGIRSSYPFDIDGLVLKINSHRIFKYLGFTGHHPKGAIACKFDPEQARTVLVDVAYQVGRTGALTPVAVFEPVTVGGVVVSRAVMHNEDWIKEKNLKIGDTVVIRRAGDVIPEIVATLSSSDSSVPIQFPTSCPSCSGPVVRYDGEAVHRCTNSSTCPAQIQEALCHYASRDAIDIEGLSDKTIELLLQEGKISSIPDLYYLTKETLEGLPKFGKKKIENLIKAIRSKMEPELARFLYALGLPLVGKETAKLIASKFGTLQAFLGATVSDLTSIDGIGITTAKGIFETIQSRAFLDLIRRLEEAWVVPKSEVKEVREGQWSEKTVVITGSFEIPRSEIKAWIESQGGKCSESVSKKTSAVIVGANPGSKYDKAVKLEIQTISSDELTQMMEGE